MILKLYGFRVWLRVLLIDFLWWFYPIRRRWCWGQAVVWALHAGDGHNLFVETKHDCYYCFACNTRQEIDTMMAQPWPPASWTA